MTDAAHFHALEALYHAAPINRFFRPRLTVARARGEIASEVRPEFCHTAGAMHGSVYFKLLDDACFFAANSLEMERFVLTSSFTTYLLRPISEGALRAVGQVVHATRSQYLVEGELLDESGELLGRGSGTFVRGPMALADLEAYTQANAS